MNNRCENLNISCYKAICDEIIIPAGCIHSSDVQICNDACDGSKCTFGQFSLTNLTANSTVTVNDTYYCPDAVSQQQPGVWVVVGIILGITAGLIIIFVLLFTYAKCSCNEVTSKFKAVFDNLKTNTSKPKQTKAKKAKQESLLVELVDEQFKQPDKYV